MCVCVAGGAHVLVLFYVGNFFFIAYMARQLCIKQAFVRIHIHAASGPLRVVPAIDEAA